jgi:predicted small secreted protein
LRAKFYFSSFLLLSALLAGCSTNQGVPASAPDIQDYSSETSEPAPETDSGEEVFPDPETGVDIYSLPSGNSFTTAYDIGAEQAESFIANSGLTRATYENLGGLDQSCKFILDTFMALSGGSSTRQQYADFLLGCSTVVRSWY